MSQSTPDSRVVRFGSFEADLNGGVLTKRGVRIKLQDQPFQILTLLLEKPGQVVSREDIRQKLWSDDTFVEFDDGLNTAVRKLRTALGDSADNPRFLETVPRRGYRFLAPVTWPAQEGTRAQTLSAVAPAVEPQQVSAQPGISGKGSQGRRLVAGSIAGVLVLVAGVLAYFHFRRPAFQIAAKDTVVLADFVNTTGDSVFDDALKQGLAVGLQQSPSMRILSDRKAAIILKQMGHSPDERLSGRTAIEVCQRTGGKVTIQGSISSLGTSYLIGLAAIRCDTGEPLALEQVEARRKEDVVDSLGSAGTRLRTRLGESMVSIRKYNAPLEQATTPSLDALNAYSLALSTWDQKGDLASIPFFKRAIELDPSFAMAYGGLATIYHNENQNDLAKENAARAYELRDRVTESERFSIESRYHLYVTGDLEKAAGVYQIAAQEYPNSVGVFAHLGTTYANLGQYEKAADSMREALRLDPTRATLYADLAIDLMALERYDDASTLLSEADTRKLKTDFLLQARYWRAFLRGDRKEMEAVLLESSEVPGAQSLLLTQEASSEAYLGHAEKARELARVASEQMVHDGDKEAAADALLEAGLRDAEVGNSKQAIQHVSQALALDHGRDVTTLSALVLARSGDLQRAHAMSDQLNKAYPSDTFLQKYWLPCVRASIDLHAKQASKALDALAVSLPLELASPSPPSVATLYPVYVRGQAYLALGDGQKAEAEFQKILGHPGLLVSFLFSPLSHLGCARAYVQTGEKEKARQAYRDFFQLWKDADPGVPIFRQAQSEYAKLGDGTR